MLDILKVPRVTPIVKGGDAVDPSNFLPISTLYSLAQIFEKLVYSQVLTYLENHDILKTTEQISIWLLQRSINRTGDSRNKGQLEESRR